MRRTLHKRNYPEQNRRRRWLNGCVVLSTVERMRYLSWFVSINEARRGFSSGAGSLFRLSKLWDMNHGRHPETRAGATTCHWAGPLVHGALRAKMASRNDPSRWGRITQRIRSPVTPVARSVFRALGMYPSADVHVRGSPYAFMVRHLESARRPEAPVRCSNLLKI